MSNNTTNFDGTIAIVGLGYVGLPLACLLSEKFKVIGLDISLERITQLNSNIDLTLEVESSALEKSSVEFTNDPSLLKNADIVIVTVPTPIDKHKNPDLTSLRNATKMIGENLKEGAVVVYESTVFPGATEDECVPILEETSGLKWKKGFNVGYSPERVNPGDKKHTIDKIIKVVSGDNDQTRDLLAHIYGSIVTAGIHIAPSIKTAEAAKVIENTQRDLNIALMNELSIIFNLMDINTYDVLNAAGTKWNFLKFTPGLVGGHCIGVDPYYLTHKAKQLGYKSKVILSGREINDKMGKTVAQRTVKEILKSNKNPMKKEVLICGFTFKENVPDYRNTKVASLADELLEYGFTPVIYDPLLDTSEMNSAYANYKFVDDIGDKKFDAAIVAVNHNIFKDRLTPNKLLSLLPEEAIIFDIKGTFSKDDFSKAVTLKYLSL